jgi:hypothetical protein
MQTSIKFYGDPIVPSEWSGIYVDGQIREAPFLKLDSMSTAIIRIYTREGFVIAADGRRQNDDGTIYSDSAQKIFPVEEPGRSLAYAMAGASHIPGGVGKMPFDFIIEAQETIKDFARRRPADLHRYAEIVSRRINSHLRDAKETGRIRKYPSAEDDAPAGSAGTTIVQIHFVGYFEGRPSWTKVTLFHRNQVLASPMIDSPRVRPGLEIVGSGVVANLLFETEDPRFASYRRAKQQDMTLAEAVEDARNYVHACSDPIGKSVDKKCEKIGGHIHIATIKPDEGFRWVEPPKV